MSETENTALNSGVASEATIQRIAKLLLKRRRGRPPNPDFYSIDFRRAFLVICAWNDNPRLRNRRQVTRYLQSLAMLGRQAADKADSQDVKAELSKLSEIFPDRDLEQSISRGMKEHGGLLREIENLRKNR